MKMKMMMTISTTTMMMMMMMMMMMKFRLMNKTNLQINLLHYFFYLHLVSISEHCSASCKRWPNVAPLAIIRRECLASLLPALSNKKSRPRYQS
jgi:hypothetical protein